MDGRLFRLCLCHDADCFSSAVLRSLLLGDEGEVAAAIAMSEKDGMLMLKLEIAEEYGGFHI